MGEIVRLDDATVNRIAAGEVVQRPANAVKEMIENSLDAGATNVTVASKGGGLKLLQVTDNGKGIAAEDFPLLCERFATSKLRSFEELQAGRVATFGFRGEALASISHVAHVRVVSMTAGAPCAHKASFEDGRMASPAPAPCAGVRGTTITVENLFFNNPLRLRAMQRSAADEYARIIEVVARYALHNSGVAFVCKKHGENRPDVHTAAGASVEDNLHALFSHAVARETVSTELPADESCGLAGLRAWFTNANANFKKGTFVLFINNRLVDCSPLKKAVDAAYAKYMPKGGHPFVYLALSIRPENVDVNVHPTKSEVRFLHETEIVELVQRAFASKLAEGNESRTFAKSLPAASQRASAAILDESAPPVVVAAAAAPPPGVAAAAAAVDDFPIGLDDFDAAVAVDVASVQQHQAPAAGDPSTPPISRSRGGLAVRPPPPQQGDAARSPPQQQAPLSPARPGSAESPRRTVVVVNPPSPGVYFQSSPQGQQPSPQGQQPSPGGARSSPSRHIPQSQRVRHDPAIRTLDSFLSPQPAAAAVAASRSKDDDEGTERRGQKRSEPDSDVLPADPMGPGAVALLPRRRPRCYKACPLTSVNTHIRAFMDKSHLGLEETLENCSFVGFADPTFVLLQNGTRLYACNVLTLCKEFFFQQVFMRFSNVGRINLRPHLDVRKMLEAAQESPALASQPIASVELGARKFIEMRAMLQEYFGIDITATCTLAALPQIVEGYIPNMAFLPIFLHNLATRVEWQYESECFETIAHQIAEFYVPHPPDIGDPPSSGDEHSVAPSLKAYEATLQNILFPALKNLLYPARSLAADGTFVQVASMENLYKVFERC